MTNLPWPSGKDLDQVLKAARTPLPDTFIKDVLCQSIQLRSLGWADVLTSPLPKDLSLRKGG
jgi:hypothetical protein